MSTYGAMIDRIADELDENNISSQIQKAIQSAIKHYEHHRFFFNEAIRTLSTSISQEYYSVQTIFCEVDSARITVNGSYYTLLPQTWNYLEETSVSGSQYIGAPIEYATFNQQVRLSPIPDSVYTILFSGTTHLATLSATTDTNDWMTDGEELIRARAKYELAINYLKDYDLANMMRQLELDALSNLNMDFVSHASTGKIRSTQF